MVLDDDLAARLAGNGIVVVGAGFEPVSDLVQVIVTLHSHEKGLQTSGEWLQAFTNSSCSFHLNMAIF
jgi:hypothetical protein